MIRDADRRAHRPGAVRIVYDYVGDLSETVALMWPTASPRTAEEKVGEVSRMRGSERASTPHPPARLAPSPAQGRRRGHNNPRPHPHRRRHHPAHARQVRAAGAARAWLDALDETGRWALLKLVTGALRIGVSARLAKTAVAALGDKDPDEIELLWPGLAPPYLDLFAWLEGRAEKPVNSIPRRSGL